ncbi:MULTISPECIES: sugar transferase [Lachnospiraceae]|uniref:Sugar transferase n=1 Tax=Faecalicatena acetigenes TaxID=2981790 RepID=A0ABT2TBU7_9FIRM|nr:MULTISPECIES: sugar transferase [Lachnospiraceae]MCU6747753.1 sugar transferase [Faecalicatena acetigenes]SCI07505.1 Putative colanic biosynthesis UDP-glucose lipid carrier transferase [uncultured Clostridium sp.]
MRKWNDLPKDMQVEEVKIYYDMLQRRKGSLLLKRIFDIIAASILLLLLSPVLLVLSVWIKTDSKGPVFFRQVRVTQYGKTFRIFKFRTMVDHADQIGTQVTTKGDARVTKVGKVLRGCRLDELPQLLNILTGDMTFVGTRPEVEKYVAHYTDEMKATLLMPAGVTSLASIEYKDEERLLESADNADQVYIEKILPEKMKYNLQSIQNFSFGQDIKTMIATVVAVIK